MESWCNNLPRQHKTSSTCSMSVYRQISLPYDTESATALTVLPGFCQFSTQRSLKARRLHIRGRFLYYLHFVEVIHQSSMNSLRKGQRCGTLFFAWTHFRANCRVSTDLRRHYSSRLAGSIDLKHRTNPARWPSGFYLASRRSSFRNETMANIWHLLPCVCWECIW